MRALPSATGSCTLLLMRRAACASIALAAVTTSLTACSLLLDTGDLSGNDAHDGGSVDGATSDGGGTDGGSDASAAGDSAGDGGGIGADGSTATTPLFDPGSMWPVSTSSTSMTPTTPAF